MKNFFFSLTLCALSATYVNAQPPVNPYQTIQAEDFDDQRGIKLSNNGTAVGFIQDGDYIGFNRLNFDDEDSRSAEGVRLGGRSINIRASSNTSGGTIEYRLGSPTGTLVGTVDIPNTGGWTSFESFTVNNTAGFIFDTVDIYLVFRGGDRFLLDVDEFSFSTEVFATGISITNCPTEIALGTTYDFDATVSPSTTTDQFVQFTVSGGTGIDIASGEYTATSLGTQTVSALIFSDAAEGGFVRNECTFEVVASPSARASASPKTKLADVASEGSLNVYPNPGEGIFKIDLAPQTRISVMNMSGRTIIPESVPNNATIDLSNYPNGLYLIRASTGQTTKLMKE